MTQYVKCKCGTLSDIEAIPICQLYICPSCAKKTTLAQARRDWGKGSYEQRPDGSIYARDAD